MSRSNLAAAALVAFVLLVPSRSWGADLDVSPVRLHLSAARRSAVLSLRNRGAEAVRYQITAEAWGQSPSGEMVLTPTSDLVFFPSLLEIAPGATRRIRIAVTAASGGAERSYRIRIEPLPDGGASRPGAIRVLTRFSVPLFVQPPTIAPEPTASVRIDRGHMRITVGNRGTSYFVSQRVHVVGRSRTGATVVEEELPGWYVLAGGERVYEVPLPHDTCTSLAEVAVMLTTEGGSTSASSPVDTERCDP